MTDTTAGPPVIFGEVLFDSFPDGEVVLGGAPFNVAWNLQALGLPPVLISRVGEDELGERILAAMADWGLDRAGIQRDPRHATGTVAVTVRDGEPDFEIAADRAYDYISLEELPHAASGGLLYHGSLALRTEPSPSALDGLREVTGGPVLMDVNLRDPWWNRVLIAGLMDEATWVKLNESELAALVPAEPDLKRRADRLLEQGGMEGLVVTRGAAGSLVRGPDGLVLEPEPVAAPKVVDTVGAGDAFSSVVILGLVRDWPWPLILTRAQAFAAAVVGLRGATTRNRSFYEHFLDNWEHS